MDTSLHPPLTTGLDPALLAFLKCHVSSIVRWELLRTLAPRKGTWVGLRTLAQQVHSSVASVQQTLAELVSEGIVETSDSPLGEPCYRLNPDDPSTRVVERLIAASARDQELRRLIIARIVNGSRRPA